MAHNSATTKLSERKLDFYPTPAGATKALLDWFPVSGTVLEPCVGKGDISKIIDEYLRTYFASITNFPQPPVLTNDINPTVTANYHLDAAQLSFWTELHDIDFVITNPPFNLASQIIPLAFDKAKIGIAMLLRASYTEPTFDRQDWLKEHEDHLAHIIYLPRISFTGDNKTDSVSCNWYCYTKEKVNGCKMHWVLKEKKKRENHDPRLLEFMRS